MRFCVFLILSVIAGYSIADTENAIQHLSASGGQISLTFYRGNVRDTGLEFDGAEQQDFQYDHKALSVLSDDSIRFLANDGFFTRLESGQLSLDTGLTITANDLHIDSSQLRLLPREFSRDILLLTDQQGMTWFTLDYGHYERLGQWLYARFLDMRISDELAAQLGDPTLTGHIVGYASLETEIKIQADELLSATETCPVNNPNWPTQDGFDGDVAMLKMHITSQFAREGGRVALAPSAYFENIGNADIPWFSQFADSRNADACCLDQGDGLCAPYGNDQGGMLVYALYRFVDGRLEQLGQSQVKHAFNSVNMDTPDGSLPCRAADRPGRVVPAGCEDLYQAGSNANQTFLGPRHEVIAHSGIWMRAGSIWDQTGPSGVPDGNCDYMPSNPVYGGQVPCMAPVADVMDRRLSVAEADLATPGARYFIEAWYLSRDDVNIINSFGRKEIKPAFTTVWSFPEVAAFKQGPVIQEFPALNDTSVKNLSDNVLSNEGQLQVSSSASRLGPNQWQYDISLMNLDFDRAVNGFDIPFPADATLSSAVFFDGDSDSANDWVVSTLPGFIRFQAPGDASLKWGSLASFRFVADRAPVEVAASLIVAGAGIPDRLGTNTLSAVEILFKDGFEQP